MTEYKSVMVYIEQRDSHIQNVSLELLGKAGELAKDLNTDVSAVVVGKNSSALADVLSHYGADRVYAVEDDRLEKYMTEPYVKGVVEVI